MVPAEQEMRAATLEVNNDTQELLSNSVEQGLNAAPPATARSPWPQLVV
jgi:hypothetical protein